MAKKVKTTCLPIVVLLAAVLLAEIPVSAGDLAWLTITSDEDARAAEAVLGHAFIRDGNTFLVDLEGGDANRLAEAGLAVEIVESNADPAETFLLAPRLGVSADQFNRALPARTIPVGDGLRLARISGREAASLDEVGLRAYPLSDFDIRFFYRSTRVSPAQPTDATYWTDTLVNLVSQDSVAAFNTRLQEFVTRFTGTDSLVAARDWLVGKFEDFGYTDISLQEVPYSNGIYHNVVVVKEGTAEPNKLVVVGGHYDAISNNVPFEAPGADDNASGTTATLEIARVLANVPMRKTVVFIPFTVEEQGLVGSRVAAKAYAEAGADIDVMVNFDMIGHRNPGTVLIKILRHEETPYAGVMLDAASRTTGLTGVFIAGTPNSDQYPFYLQGYDAVFVHEYDFNQSVYHTTLDLIDSMDFAYETEVIKMGLATVGIAANTSSSTDHFVLQDVGDGQSLRVSWDEDCRMDYSYQVVYGLDESALSDTVDIPAGMCSYTLDGLMSDTAYHVAVVGQAVDAYPPLKAAVKSLDARVIPRAPVSFMAEPDAAVIHLDWADSPELDFDYFEIYRKADGEADFTLYQTGLTASSYTDAGVASATRYEYKIATVDVDANRSDYSEVQSTMAAFFDQGVLAVRDIAPSELVVPDEYYDTLFGAEPYTLVALEQFNSAVDRGTLGQYSSVFWFDDDQFSKPIGFNLDSLAWYGDYGGNIFLAGWRTIEYGFPDLSSDSIPLTEFGLLSHEVNPTTRSAFVGAHPQHGWPSLRIDPSRGRDSLRNIAVLEPIPEAKVIYTFDARDNDPEWEGRPVGYVWNGPRGIRVLLGFPVYYLERQSVHLLVESALSLMGETSSPGTNGDADLSGVVDIADLGLVIDFLFAGGALPDTDRADVDGSCRIDSSDLGRIVRYLFGDGEPLEEGCVTGGP